jgi:predicted phage baseplate assembly protein
VLPGQRIEVLEPSSPSPAERRAMTLAGVRSVEPALAEDGTVKGVWVEWIEVSDFHTSGPRDRHYLLNRMTGAVTFGDGVQGMVPPAGTANIRARSYRAGGGSRGNKPAGTITELKTTVANVQGVTNTVPSVGGTDLGSEAALEDLGPRVLRHGHVAMTAEDYEDLARAASPDVARARTVTPHFDPIAQEAPTPSLPAGSVLVIIVPSGSEPRPAPSLSLIEDVRSHLLARCPPAVALKVTGPDWVRVTAQVTIAPVSIEASDELVAEARAALDRYLHPLTGGADGEGWEFGKLPWASDLYPILTAVRGAHHIRRLELVYEREQESGVWTVFPEDTPPDAMLRILVFSGPHTIDVYSGDEG